MYILYITLCRPKSRQDIRSKMLDMCVRVRGNCACVCRDTKTQEAEVYKYLNIFKNRGSLKLVSLKFCEL